MIKAVVIEEISVKVDLLLQMLKDECPEVQILSVADSMQKGIRDINTFNPDLVFLDIAMPGKLGADLFLQLEHFKFDLVFIKTFVNGDHSVNVFRPQVALMNIKVPSNPGFDFIQQLEQTDFDVIFATAMGHQQVRSFQFSAMQYLQQPFGPAEFKSMIRELIVGQALELNGHHLGNLTGNYNKSPRKRLALPTSEGYNFIEIRSIVRCEGEGTYSRVHLTEGRKSFLVCKNLKEIGEILRQHSFCRVHRSHLINLDHAAKYIKGDGGYVRMLNNDVIPVSKRKKEAFVEMLNSM